MSSEELTSKQLEELRAELRQYGQSRFPALHEEVDDLASQALSDLWQYLKRRPKDQAVDVQSAHRIAFSIFKRRAVDVFRKNAKQWALNMDDIPETEQADPRPYDAIKSDLYQRMLRICIAELAEVPETDRVLLALVVGIGPESTGAMDARDRQRLHRLRQRLTSAIRRKLGEDANKLLRDNS